MKDASKVQAMCQGMIEAGRARAFNYAMLNELYNGGNPWTAAEAQADHQHTNVNWLVGTEKIHEARSQARQALKGSENFFTVKLDVGSVHKRRECGLIITKNLNRILKRSRAYDDTIDAGVSQMIVQGIGPATWMNRDDWCPKPRSIADMLIPSDTLTSRENLCHFGARIHLTAADLIKAATGKLTDKGWNQKMIGPLIDKLLKTQPGSTPLDYWDNPVALVEEWKQNGPYYLSDAIPVLHCFDFYYLDPTKRKWFRQVIIDCQTNQYTDTAYKNEFLYDNKDLPYGDDVSNILDAIIADGAVVAPSKWHSVRSLGYMMFPMAQADNRLRCKLMDATWESLLMLFRASSPGQRELLQKVDLRHLGILPDGIAVVPENERHAINYELASGMLSMNRQLISENASTYTREVDDGKGPSETATGVMARVTAANKLQNAILSNLYDQKMPEYREISRRFCVTKHPDCIKFRERCQAEGVDPAVFDVEAWEIAPERSAGGGDKMLQIAIADKLMALSPRMNPRAQNAALHMSVEAITGDSDVANELVPLEGEDPSPSSEKASLAWGTLIDGKPITLGGDVNRIELVEEWMKQLAIEFIEVQQNGGQPPPMKRILGIVNVINTIKQTVQQVAMDETRADWIREQMQTLGVADNMIKGWRQQLQQAQQAASGAPGEDQQTAADVKAVEIKANAQATAMTHKAEQQRAHKQAAFDQAQAQKDQKTAADITAQGARTQVELAGMAARNRLQLQAMENQPANGDE